jgi:mono/diheme cytochrome c family protein
MRLLFPALLAAAVAAGAAQALPPSSARPLSPDTDERLFRARCGYCHEADGTGTMMLERRLGKSKALLAARGDLQPAYVRGVVRHGLKSMPAISRVEVTDPELARITAFLARPPGAAR